MTDFPPAADRYVLRPTLNRFSRAACGCVVLFLICVAITWQVHPHVPDVLRVLLVVFPVSAVVLGLAGRQHVRREERRGASIVLRVVGVLTLLVLGISIVLPSLCGTREGAQIAKCRSNLMNLWCAIDSYAKSHGGNYPPTLESLVSEVGITPELLVCPASNDERAVGSSQADMLEKLEKEAGHVSYVYVPPRVTPGAAPADGVLLYEHPENHRHDHLHVLFRSGEIRYLTRSEANALIPALANAPMPPKTEHPETW